MVSCEGGGGAKQNGGKAPASTGAGLKAVWMGAEAFGNVLGTLKGGNANEQRQQQQQQPQSALSREEVLQSIRQDFDVDYFVSGKGDMAAYEPDCEFADPFASFRGTERFKRNVSNLGGLLSDIDLKLTGWEEGEDELRTKWRFSAILDLPWKPLLAAAGGTTFVFDGKSGLVTKHIESWDVEPARVLRQLLKPSAKVPATQAEVLMASVHDGDALGVWLAVSSKVAVAALPASGLLAVLHLVRGEGLGWLEAAVYVAWLGAVGTELVKIVRTFVGGGS